MVKPAPEISTKGLDDFSKKFLTGENRKLDQEYIVAAKGQKVTDQALTKYAEMRKVEFVKRSATFTEDLIAFIVEQKKLRELTDEETVFGLALANINLREAFGSPQSKTEKMAVGDREKLLDTFDEICVGAQSYYDANSKD